MAWHAWPFQLLALGLLRDLLRPFFVRSLLIRWRLHVGVAREGARMKGLQTLLELHAHAKHVRVLALDEVTPWRQVIFLEREAFFQQNNKFLWEILFPNHSLKNTHNLW